jgi:hypothetical protein
MGFAKRFLRACIVGEIKVELVKIHHSLINLELKTMTALTDLQARVAANTTVVASAVTLIQGLKASLDAAIAANAGGDNGAALAELSASLDSTDTALAAAITANTPAATP